MGRRRRRSQAAIRSFPDQDEMDPVTEPEPDIEQEEAPADIEETVEVDSISLDKSEKEGDVDTGDIDQHSKADNALDVGQPQEPNVEEEEKLTKEQEIWEGMRDEFHPVLEQLPLSLHRTFTLMRELDGQGARYLADIIPRLEEYIKLRNIMIETPQPLPEPAAEPSTATGAGTANEAGQTETKADANEDGREEPSTPKTPPRQLRRVSSRSRSPTKRSRLGRTASSLKAIPDSPNPAPPRPKTPPSARSILSSVGVLLEEAMHSSQEKVNLAQAAYDSADRHIRLLDQAILEQETSLSIGIRPGTHPALLPEISVPRWQRNAQTMYSPLPGDESDNPLPFSGAALAQVELEGAGTMIGVTEDAIPAPGTRPVVKRRRGRKKGVEPLEKAVTPLPIAGATAPRLKLKVPPLAAVVQANNAAIVPVDPNEPTYCYCNQVSYGDMVGCDNDECPYEWFHLACVGLTEVPKSTKWYCKDCREAMGLGAPRKRKR